MCVGLTSYKSYLKTYPFQKASCDQSLHPSLCSNPLLWFVVIPTTLNCTYGHGVLLKKQINWQFYVTFPDDYKQELIKAFYLLSRVQPPRSQWGCSLLGKHRWPPKSGAEAMDCETDGSKYKRSDLMGSSKTPSP